MVSSAIQVVPVELEPLSSSTSVVADGVRLLALPNLPARVVGVDAVYLDPPSAAITNATGERVVAAAVVLDSATFEVVEVACMVGRTVVEYHPGRLAFREAPAVLAAIDQLSDQPELVVCDGQGTAHPERAGLACHVGYALDVPTIGCAKNVFVGSHETPGVERGAYEELIDDDQVVGAVVRTRSEVKPVVVSPGHLVDLRSSIRHVLALSPKYRLPETTRAADGIVREAAAIVR